MLRISQSYSQFRFNQLHFRFCLCALPGCELTRNVVGTDVNDDTTRLQPLSLDKLGLSDGSNDDVGVLQLHARNSIERIIHRISLVLVQTTQ